ncbi:MAG: TM2 domain-containing protein [archaeon]|nr:TM2 domain-containing protein [archaeon]
MFLFLLCFNFFLSFSFSQRIIYFEEEDRVLRDLSNKEVKIVFKCVKTPSNETEESEFEEHPCKLENTNCTDYGQICECKKEFATKEGAEVFCEYKRKKQLTAFLLELFVGFGAGHFYRGEYLMASLKLAAFLFGIYIICLFPLTVKCFDSCCESDCCIILISIVNKIFLIIYSSSSYAQ